jgi:uncharacterized protein YqgC (DUF456 family)
MFWLYYLLLLAVCFCGLFLVVLALPGLWLMVASAAIYAMLTGGRFLGLHTLIALFVLAILAEILELVSGSAATKKAGGSGRAAIGGLVGAILGGIVFSFIPLWPISSIAGICVGTFLGAGAMELWGGKSAAHSLRVGVGATKGRVMGMIWKFTIGAICLLLIFWQAMP